MKWLNSNIGTGAYEEVSKDVSLRNLDIVDVRDLVDKQGNDIRYVSSKINEAIEVLKQNRKVIICCDYGMSRSNSIAIGVLVKWLGISFEEAVIIAKKVVNESDIKIEILNTVYDALLVGTTPMVNHNKKVNKLLLTGASGFVGRNIVKGISKIFELTCPSSKEIDLLESAIGLDLLIKSKKIDCIIHLANPRIFTQAKSIGDTLVMLKNVLDVCRTNSIKLIYLSGWEVYSGYRSENLLANEELSPNPKGTYGETKWFAELLIKQYSLQYNVQYQIIRSGPVYGPMADKPKFIYNFAHKARNNQVIKTHRYLNGPPSLDLLYIDDLVELIKKCVSSDYVGELNVGTGRTVSTFEVASEISKIIGSESKIEQVIINDYAPNIAMDFAKANNLFGWSPKVTFPVGLRLTLEKDKS